MLCLTYNNNYTDDSNILINHKLSFLKSRGLGLEGLMDIVETPTFSGQMYSDRKTGFKIMYLICKDNKLG